MNLNKFEQPLGIAVLVGIFLLAFMSIQPFFLAAIWGGLIAFATWPAHYRLSKALKSRVASALLLALAMSTMILTPLLVAAITVINKHQQLLDYLVAITHTRLPDVPDWLTQIPLVGEPLTEYWIHWQTKGKWWFTELLPHLQSLTAVILHKSSTAAASFAQILLAIFFAGWFYMQGEVIANSLRSILARIMGSNHGHYWHVAASTIQNVINGVIGTAFAQGIIAGIGFWIAGIPFPMLLGLLTLMFSFVPMLPPLIWLGATAWLFFQDQIAMSIFMFTWGILGISGVDNLVKPYLISRGSVLPVGLIILGVAGGVFAFGFLGLFLGPVVLALAFTIIKEWLAQQNAQGEAETVKTNETA